MSAALLATIFAAASTANPATSRATKHSNENEARRERESLSNEAWGRVDPADVVRHVDGNQGTSPSKLPRAAVAKRANTTRSSSVTTTSRAHRRTNPRNASNARHAGIRKLSKRPLGTNFSVPFALLADGKTDKEALRPGRSSQTTTAACKFPRAAENARARVSREKGREEQWWEEAKARRESEAFWAGFFE